MIEQLPADNPLLFVIRLTEALNLTKLGDHKAMPDQKIVLFDGGCGFCSRIVELTQPRMRSKLDPVFLSLLSDKGKEIHENLPLKYRQIDSLLYLDGEKIYILSTAIIRCLMKMTWPYAALTPLVWIVPAPLRNWIYRRIAASRKSFSRDFLHCHVEQKE